MTASIPPANQDDRGLYWVTAPAVLLALLAVMAVGGDANTGWFIRWNQLALAVPGFLWAGATNLGSTAGAYALLGGGLAWRPRWVAAALLALPAGALYTHGLKEFFAEARPAAVLDPDQINIIGKALLTSSFPSGHAVTAFGLAAAVALCSAPSGRRWIAWAALAVATVVAFSRVAVGAHWPLDVLAGGAGGWLCGAIGVWWSARWRFWNTPRGVRILAVIVALLSLSLFFEDLGYPEGRWAQYALALWGLAGALVALATGTRWSRT